MQKPRAGRPLRDALLRRRERERVGMERASVKYGVGLVGLVRVAFEGVAPLHAARTSQRDVPTARHRFVAETDARVTCAAQRRGGCGSRSPPAARCPRGSSGCTLRPDPSYGAGIVIVLESSVTAAVRANSRPSTVAPVVTVMEAKARMLPLNTEPVPRVAELLTCQKTLAALAPPLKITCRPTVVVRVDPIWKMNTAFASPWASSVRSPEEISSDVVDLYRPGVRVWPPRFPATRIAPTVRPAASLYAVVKSSCTWAAAASAAWMVPLTIPGGNPVTAVPGLNPRSPLTML